MQCIHFDGISSTMLTMSSGVPQGSVLGLILFSIYVDALGRNIPDAEFHFYADDMVIYFCGSALAEAPG